MKVDGKSSKDTEGGGKKKGNGYAGRIVWSNPKPDSADVTFLEGEAKHYVANVVELVSELRENERVSVKLDSHSGRWLAILFVMPSADGDATQALSVRGATPVDALVLLHYFHHVKFPEGWAEGTLEVSGQFG